MALTASPTNPNPTYLPDTGAATAGTPTKIASSATTNVATQGVGGIQYNPNTGEKLLPGQQYTPLGNNSTFGTLPVSTTTLTNGNKINQVNGIISKTTDLSQTGSSVDANGNIITSNGTVTPPPAENTNVNGPKNTSQGGYYKDVYYGPNQAVPVDANGKPVTLTETSASSDAITKNINDLIARSDAMTASTLQNIHAQYANLIQQQQQANAGQQASIQNSLLMGGVTGKGSASQYAPISSSGIISSQINYGLQQIADLNTKEQTAIIAAQQAGLNQDYQLMNQLNGEIEKTRTEKINAATKLNDTIAEQNKKLAEDNLQASKDTAIANIYTSGVTDVTGILAKLKEQGVTATSKDIADTLKNIIPVGLDDLVKTLRTNGAPQDVISKVLASKDINEAYTNAGNYAAGGTGIIGEYNFYKAQATAAGQVPVDFNTYQNMDANRKAKVAGAGIGNTGLPSSTLTKVTTIANKFESEPSVKNYQVVSEGKAFLDSLDNNTQNPADQQGAIYAFAKIMDPNSVVREGEYNTVQKYAQSWADTFGFNAKRIFTNSPFLSPTAIANMKATVASKAQASENSYKNIYDEYGRKINKITGQSDGSEYLTDYSQGYGQTGNDIIDSEAQNEQKVTTGLERLKISNPKIYSAASKMYIAIDPTTNKPYTATDLLSSFPDLNS